MTPVTMEQVARAALERHQFKMPLGMRLDTIAWVHALDDTICFRVDVTDVRTRAYVRHTDETIPGRALLDMTADALSDIVDRMVRRLVPPVKPVGKWRLYGRRAA